MINCLVVNPITFNNVAALFNYTMAGRASDLIKAQLSIKLVGSQCSVFDQAHRCSTFVFLLVKRFSKSLAVEYPSCLISVLDLDLYVCCFDA